MVPGTRNQRKQEEEEAFEDTVEEQLRADLQTSTIIPKPTDAAKMTAEEDQTLAQMGINSTGNVSRKEDYRTWRNVMIPSTLVA